jgi:hypothetical protein
MKHEDDEGKLDKLLSEVSPRSGSVLRKYISSIVCGSRPMVARGYLFLVSQKSKANLPPFHHAL